MFIGRLHVFFGELSYQTIYPLKNLIIFLLLGCKSSLYILSTSFLSDICMICVYSHYSASWSFHFLGQALFVSQVECWIPELSTKFSKCLKLWSSLKFFESGTRLWDVAENSHRLAGPAFRVFTARQVVSEAFLLFPREGGGGRTDARMDGRTDRARGGRASCTESRGTGRVCSWPEPLVRLVFAARWHAF